jgi:hypothetical protein
MSAVPARAVRRLWRLRKLHQQVDATIHETGDAVELRLRYNSTVVYRRAWSTRSLAVAAAEDRRAVLERQGWIAHW